jgi:formylglycine-generating enzyme required for sulfatase activity
LYENQEIGVGITNTAIWLLSYIWVIDMFRFRRLTLLIIVGSIIIPGCGTSKDISEPTAKVTSALAAASTGTPIPILIAGDTQIRPKDGMVMVYVPAGEFVMGSNEDEVDFALQQCKKYGDNCRRRYFSVEMPMHSVILDSYWIDQTEVTIGQYQECLNTGACDATGCLEETQEGSKNYPAVCVTWEQAAAYCEWAGARLPTEAEWEYAARGPERRRYPWGDELEGTYLNYCDINCPLGKRDEIFDDGYARSAPVGSFPQGASWVGAMDMAGNVWEMVADWNGKYPTEKQLNPTGPTTGERKVARGGSWNASPDHVRSALRTHMAPGEAIDHAGFRCVQSDH